MSDRQFSAFARPCGDAAFGIAGPLVEVHERRKHCLEKVRVLTRAEAEQLHAELGAALRAFALAKDFAGGIASETGARASTAPYPFRDHRTLEEVFGSEVVAAAGASEAA